jgi:hypothetical protein
MQSYNFQGFKVREERFWELVEKSRDLEILEKELLKEFRK